jgi:hypothetical protein
MIDTARRPPNPCADIGCSLVPAARHLASFSARHPSPPSTSWVSSACPGAGRHPFAAGGAAIETSFSGAYNLAQFFGWKWGKKERPAGAARFTLAWIAMFGLAMAVVMTGYDPVKLTEYSVIFSVVALPLTYLPILLVANDPSYMGTKVNGRLANTLGILYFVIILAISISAIPLMLVTHGGQG